MDYSRRAILALLAGGTLSMALKPDNPLVGGVSLARAQIQSPNFVTGSTGWVIRQDGSAEFNNVTIRGGVTIGGNSFYYSTPAPAANTLVASIAASGGHDSAGNPYVAGHASYAFGSSLAVSIVANTLNYYQLSGGVWSSVASIFYDTGTNLVNLGLAEASSLAVTTLSVTGTVTATAGTAAAPNKITTDTWQTMSLINSWSLGASGYAQYKLEPNNRVSVRGANIVPGTTTGGTSIWTPPTGPPNYAPATTQRIEMIVEVSTGTAGVDTPRFDAAAGGFQVFNIPGSTTRVGFNGSYALD